MSARATRRAAGTPETARTPPGARSGRGAPLHHRESAPPDLFVRLCRASKLPEPVTEYRFAPPRRWRMDYAWPDHRVALEVEGGVWTRGRHTRGAGFLADVEKYNAAAAQGWRVLRCTPDTLATEETLDLVRRALSPSPPPP